MDVDKKLMYEQGKRSSILAIDILEHPLVKGMETEIKILRVLLDLKNNRIAQLENGIESILEEK